jgi:hypothetical protein
MADTTVRPQEVDGWNQAERALERDERAITLSTAALERLRIQHLAFRRAAPEELRELEDLRLAILDRIAADASLEEYYQEAWNGQLPQPVEGRPAAVTAAHRYVVVAQLQLMERAFYVLQLHHYANAPENSGWMNLFRQWGMSPRFNDVFDEVEASFTPEFVAFYLTYLRASLPSDHGQPRVRALVRDDPPLVHHPWLRQPADRGRGIFMDSGLVEAALHDADSDIDVRPGAGGIGDAKGKDGVDQVYEKPSSEATPGQNAPERAPNE